MRSKTNCELLARILPHLSTLACVCSEFWLVHCVIFIFIFGLTALNWNPAKGLRLQRKFANTWKHHKRKRKKKEIIFFFVRLAFLCVCICITCKLANVSENQQIITSLSNWKTLPTLGWALWPRFHSSRQSCAKDRTSLAFPLALRAEIACASNCVWVVRVWFGLL